MNVQNNPLVLKAKNTMTTTSSVQTANRKRKAFGTPNYTPEDTRQITIDNQ